MSGYPWATGDELLAADLNAAIAAASSAVGAGGPFLPIAGGCVTGGLTAGAGLNVKGQYNGYNSVPSTWTGSSATSPAAPLFISYVLNGSSTSAGGIWFHQFQVQDSIVSTPPFSAHNCINSQINTAAGMVGVPQAIAGQVVQGATSGMHAAGSAYTAVTGIFSNYASYNEGGTSAAYSGSVFGINPDVMLNAGATWFAELCGGEVNVSAYSGSSVFAKWGLAFTKKTNDAVQGSAGVDAAIVLADQTGTTANWNYGILFGNEGGSPCLEGGTAIGTRMMTAGHRQALKWNLDFISNTTSGGSIRSPGFTVDPQGRVYVGPGVIEDNGSGLSIDTGVHVPVSATVNAGGSNYGAGNIPDVAGNLWNITVSGGAVTAATLVQPVPMPGAPATVALASGGYYGTGAVLNVAYSAYNSLLLQPSGGPVVTGGALTASGNLTGAQVTGSAGIIECDGPNTSWRSIQWTTSGSRRWAFYTNGTSDGTGNVGSDFLLDAFANDGATVISTPIAITRSTGRIALAVLQASTTYANDAVAATGGIAVGQLYRNGSVVQIRVA